MIPLILLFGFFCCISCQIILPESPSQQLLVEQPSGHITTTPIDVPTRLSRGERLTLSTPGFRIGEENEPIEIIPPVIGNWVDSPDAGQAVQSTSNETNTTSGSSNNTTHTLDTTNTTNATNTTTSDEVIARDPWSALTGINITITSSNITENTTASPTWIDVQNEREHQYHAPRPDGFPTFNLSVHGNMTSFNLTVHNMTANITHGNHTDAWFLPGGSEDESITGNITGTDINMSIISPNSSTIITNHPNGTVSIISHGNETTTEGETNTTIITQPHTPDQNITIPSSANQLCVSFISTLIVGMIGCLSSVTVISSCVA